MPVSPEVRKIEAGIDEGIKGLSIWRPRRDSLLRALLDYYRDAIEVMFLHAAHGQLFSNSEALIESFAMERDLHAGLLQSLKWAVEFSDSNGEEAAVTPEQLHEITELGARYENFVDLLKMGQHNRVHISVSKDTQTIRVFEGGDRTGFDAQLVSFQHETLPMRHQLAAVDDHDQLTRHWSAGDFRRAIKMLAANATEKETETLVFQLPGQSEPTPLFKRPVVFDVAKEIFDEHRAVFEDMLLDPAKVAGENKWRLNAWPDVPLTLIGGSPYIVSNMAKAVVGVSGDDYMLRIAARVDPPQYSTASELRHNRMMETCKKIVKDWKPKGHFLLP